MKKQNQKTLKNKNKKVILLKTYIVFLKVDKWVLNCFKSKIFPLPPTEGTRGPSDLTSRFKVLTSKQILQVLPTALPQVKAGGTSKKLLNQIHQIIYSL